MTGEIDLARDWTLLVGVKFRLDCWGVESGHETCSEPITVFHRSVTELGLRTEGGKLA